MKYIFRNLFLVSAVALTLCFATAANVSAAETETVETVTQEATAAETETEEYISSDIFYVVFIGSAIFGSLVALGFWVVFRS